MSAPRLPQAEQVKRRPDVGQPHIVGPSIAAHGADVPMLRMSAKVISCGRSGMAHDPADLNDREATTPWGQSNESHMRG
jgi:hypothetical protein